MDFEPRDLELLENNPRRSIEPEPSPELEPRPRFSWVAFFVMIIALGVAYLVGLWIPGPFDNLLYEVVIASIYGFIQAHNFKAPKK